MIGLRLRSFVLCAILAPTSIGCGGGGGAAKSDGPTALDAATARDAAPLAPFGANCSANGDCQSHLCLPIGRCTRKCGGSENCPAVDWTCSNLEGVGLLCQCQPSGPEVCDGHDNDCDGVVDNGAVCPDNQVCKEGMCVCAFALCATSCVDTGSDPLNCGQCGVACGAGASCVQGACLCPVPQMVCGGTCVDVTRDPDNCGGCGMKCAAPQAVVGCNNGCVIDSCMGTFADCDKQYANGCESDLTNDAANCGACGFKCSQSNATELCVSSNCVIASCSAGYMDCDHDPSNGCECGGAGAVCSNNRCAQCGTTGNACCSQGALCSGGGCCWNGACIASGSDCAAGSSICNGGFCLSCGGYAQTCCATPGSACGESGCCVNGACIQEGQDCGSGQTCLKGACVPCGGANQPCCDRNVCTGSGCCANGTCVAAQSQCGSGSCANGSCGGCGGMNESCCGGANGYCAFSNSYCNQGQCAPCGSQGEPCCNGGECPGGGCCYLAGGVRTCVAFNRLCPNQNLCMSGSCGNCGALGQPCCAGSFCTAGETVCANNTCVLCGAAGEPCCAPNDYCAAGHTCSAGTCQ